MTINDGGPVFPMTVKNCSVDVANGGMSLRDYFAGQSMVGMLAFPGAIAGNTTKTPDDTARLSYDFADAMIAARGAK